MNRFSRVKLSALQADFGTASFDISAPVAGMGRPLDWMLFTGSFISSMNSGVRKAGANRIVLTQLGSDGGFKDIVGQSISWTGDGSGPASGSTGGLGHVQTAQVIGNGMRLEVVIGSLADTGRWPDALDMRVWDLCSGVRQVSYAGSVQGDPDAVAVVEHIGPPNDENNAFTTQQRHLTDFIFASEVPGAVARLDVTRNATSMGNWPVGFAIALYRAPRTAQAYRGGTQAIIGSAQ